MQPLVVLFDGSALDFNGITMEMFPNVSIRIWLSGNVAAKFGYAFSKWLLRVPRTFWLLSGCIFILEKSISKHKSKENFQSSLSYLGILLSKNFNFQIQLNSICFEFQIRDRIKFELVKISPDAGEQQLTRSKFIYVKSNIEFSCFGMRRTISIAKNINPNFTS